MGLSKLDRKKDKLALYSKTNIDWSTPKQACKKFISDLAAINVKTE
jgi:hypothetical protein